MACQDHTVTSLVIVDADDPEARVIKQMIVRGQHVKVHQGSSDFSVSQGFTDVLVSLIVTHLIGVNEVKIDEVYQYVLIS